MTREILSDGEKWRVLHGDCLDVMRGLPDGCVDAVVTDPPYGLSFMGKRWDYDVPSVEIWAEALRVLKPGGHLLAFAGTRTQHRMAVRIEDAGFEIRDMIAWVYGSGFPKSHNLKGDWDGWGTALKPSLEPITVARKPFKGTVAQNVAEHSTGALNVDGCRVAAADSWETSGKGGYDGIKTVYDGGTKKRVPQESHALGRWPANLLHDGSPEVVELFPQSEAGTPTARRGTGGIWSGESNAPCGPQYGDTGSAARFFYCAKADRAEREEGLAGAPLRASGMVSNTSGQHMTRRDEGYEVAPRANNHPTVKPVDLMRWLCRLVTPPGGLVLDPFAGSGTTGVACALEGFRLVGIDKDEAYAAIAQRRIAAAYAQGKLNFDG